MTASSSILIRLISLSLALLGDKTCARSHMHGSMRPSAPLNLLPACRDEALWHVRDKPVVSRQVLRPETDPVVAMLPLTSFLSAHCRAYGRSSTTSQPLLAPASIVHVRVAPPVLRTLAQMRACAPLDQR